MKVLIFILACAAVSSAALLPGYVNYNDGKYYPGNTGQYENAGRYYPSNYVQDYSSGKYAPDDNGRYFHDDSGKYIHEDNPYIHLNNPYIHDNIPSVPYEHQDNPYEHQDNPYVHGYEYAAPATQLQIRVPPRTYLPIQPQPTILKPKVIPVIVTPKPVIPKPVTPAYKGGGNYKWDLDLQGNHKVEHPHYGLQVKLPNTS